MTLAEIVRAMDSFERKRKRDLQSKAQFDYMLADLIGISVARMFDSNTKMPSIHQVYPSLFMKTEEEKEQEQEDINVARFMAFASQHNKKFEEKNSNNSDE